jgi:hypothetical protein
MSYGNPRPVNPASKFIEWKGAEGKFFYYVKSQVEGVPGENKEISLPIKFIVIDELAMITGYNKELDCGLYSNEVHNIKSEVFHVKSQKGGKVWTGTYDDLKGTISGAKFTKSIYAMVVLDGKPELVNFKISGSFLNAWIEAKINTDVQGVMIDDLEKKKNGAVNYFQPVLKGFTPPNPDKAKLLAKTLFAKLKDYFEARKQYVVEDVIIQEQLTDAPDSETMSDDEIPF